MSDKSTKLSKFWQELKRRKVLKVIAMYAGAAYVLIELANNVVEPLNLPDWTPRLVILILILGFPIVAILSWIFDITHEGFVKTEPSSAEEESVHTTERRKFKISDAIIGLLFIVVCVLLYPRVFERDKFVSIRDESGKISIAVMPFENLTGDTALNWFQRGISSLIINGLGSSSELVVRDDHTMHEVIEELDQSFTVGLAPSMSKLAAKKAGALAYISGNCQGQLDKYRIFANIVDAESGDVLWSGKVEGNLNSSEYLDMADSLCMRIKDFLEIKALKQGVDFDFRDAYTSSSDAYKHYVEGMNSMLIQSPESAILSFKKALEVDSTFTLAQFYLAWAYADLRSWEDIEYWIQKAYQSRDKLPPMYQHTLELSYAWHISKNLQDIIRFNNLLAESNTQSRWLLITNGIGFLQVNQYEKAVEIFERIEEIDLQRGKPWEFGFFYNYYGEALHKTGNHEKENEVYELGLRLCPENSGPRSFILNNQAICALSRGDTIRGLERLQKMKDLLNELGYPEFMIERFVGFVYEDVDMIKKAAEHFENVYNLDPGNSLAIYTKARYLIKHDVNIEEGMELLEQAIDLRPDYPVYLYMKSLGYYKLGNYEEAQKYVSKAEEGWKGYYHELFELSEKIERALAS